MGLEVLGTQLAVELFDCGTDRLRDTRFLADTLESAAKSSGATIVESVFHTFNPHGASGVLIIAESHIAIHTWPEFGYAALDVFTCGSTVNPDEIADYIQQRLQAGRIKTTRLQRGILKDPLHGSAPSSRLE